MKYKVADDAAGYENLCEKVEFSIKKVELEYSLTEEAARADATSAVAETAGADATSAAVETAEIDGVNKTDSGYLVKLGGNETRSVKVKLESPIQDSIIFISFKVDNDIEGEESTDVSVSINGVKNKLTAAEWKYYNENERFEYVLDGTEYTDTLDVKLYGGVYEITDIECYTLEYEEIKQLRDSVSEFYIDKEKTSGDIIEGSIDVADDGWFHISLPYDKGFDIYVDGEKTDYYTSDEDFVGFAISKGHHDIVIKYTAAGFNIGMILSAAGLVLLLSEAVLALKTRKKGIQK
jgi:uncharacterized membrane protein YfhO